MIETIQRPRKRLFLALILVSLMLSSFIAYCIWKVSFLGLADISEHLPIALGVAFAVVLSVAVIGILGIVFDILGKPTLVFFHRQAWMAINLLFPIAVLVGRLIDIDKELIERSFIEVSNQLIKGRKVIVPPDRLLVITPHCLQAEKCPHKITRDPKNCKQCGGCSVGGLLALSEKYGFNFAVVTGGTLSRQIIRSMRPKAVLAIACERDLTSGIQDIYPLPVIGVLNERPCGPCNNTRVDIDKVEVAVQSFLKKKAEVEE